MDSRFAGVAKPPPSLALISRYYKFSRCTKFIELPGLPLTVANLAQPRPFSSSHVNQILGNLIEAGLIYKNRHGRYSLAVPLLGDFIQRNRRSPRSS